MSGKVWHWLCGLLFPQLGLEKKNPYQFWFSFWMTFKFLVSTLYTTTDEDIVKKHIDLVITIATI